MKKPTKYLLSICFILLIFIISSFVVFNVYAQQQGGAATGGTGQLNQGTGMTITCTVNNACVITGNSATGGAATGGSTNGNNGSTILYPTQTNSATQFSPPVDGVPCDDLKYHFTRPFHIHVHLDIFVNGQNYIIPSQIGITDKCFYILHTHNADGIIHIESPENTIYTLGMLLDIWHSQSNINWGIPSKVYINGDEVNKNSYRDIPLQQLDEIVLVYGKPDVGPMNYNWPAGY